MSSSTTTFMTSHKLFFLFRTQFLYMENKRVRLLISQLLFNINDLGFEAKYRTEYYIILGLAT